MDDRYRQYFTHARRVVVKVGSNVLTQTDGLNREVIFALSGQISRLMETGRQVLVVSSGAMAVGVKKMGLAARPEEIPKRQAVAAMGQSGLMMAWEQAFSGHNRKVAQILLTDEDLSNRKRYLNARNTVNVLLNWQVVPVINENDTVSVEEIKLGDNDNLSARMALLMDADILINLTDIDGLFTHDPRVYPEARLIAVIEEIDRRIERIAGDIPGRLGTGGMRSKITAARKVTTAGIPMVIARGNDPRILDNLFDGKPCGSFFVPMQKRLAGRKCWIAYNLKPKGRLTVDAGAVDALLNRGKSLLPIGVVDVAGDFGVGDPVAFCGMDHGVIGVGLANYTAAQIRKIRGLKTSQILDRLGGKPYDEIIHRDNLVITPLTPEGAW